MKIRTRGAGVLSAVVWCLALFSGALLSVGYVGAVEPGPVESFKQRVVGQVCSDKGEWLKCFSLQPSLCAEKVSPIVSACATSAFNGMAVSLNPDQAFSAAKRFQECFNRSWSSQFGVLRRSTPECMGPPAHMKDREMVRR